MKIKQDKPKEGQLLYGIATGRVNPFRKRSRLAVKLLTDQDGFVAVYQNSDGRLLFFYDSLNNAKGARNTGESEGIQIGNNICEFRADADGSVEFVGVC